MSHKRIALLVSLAAAGLLGAADLTAAPVPKPIAASRAHAPLGHSHGHRGSPGARWNRGSRAHSPHWGWGLGLAIGVPWALGWYEPSWGPAYYPPYAYGPVYRSYSRACEPDEECWQERLARSEPTPPTTVAGPLVPGEEGGPTQRPLHLNYCDASKAWFPHVRTCAGGWRLVLPDYGGTR